MMFRIFNFKNFLILNLLLLVYSYAWAAQLVNKPGYSYYPEKLSKNSINSSYNSNSVSIHPYQWNLVKYYDPLGSGEYVWRGDNFAGGWKLIQKHVKKKPGEGVVVAVIDTGYIPHPSFKENLLSLEPGGHEYGYNFLYDCRLRVSGEGACPATTDPKDVYRDPSKNAFDYGTYLLDSEIKAAPDIFSGTKPHTSSWHGTAMIGAIASNGYKDSNPTTMAGGAYGAKIVPIRIIGKGIKTVRFSMIIGLLWAAGISKPEIPRNLYPADVINLSLGNHVPCSPELQGAIDAVNEKGSIIVASAGNHFLDVSKASPANCKGVISVAAKRPDNKLHPNSNFGAVTITAAGGIYMLSPCPDYICGIQSLGWSSELIFNPNDKPLLVRSYGTSPAAAHVSAAIANIIGVLKARGETYDYNRIVKILQDSASTFAEGGNCSAPGKCVPNRVLDVGKAIELVLEKDLKKDYIFVNKGMITNHALARCPATVSIDTMGAPSISKVGGDDKCISYDINNAKVYTLKYSYTKDYLLAATDQGLYVCNIEAVKCQLEVSAVMINYISNPEISIDQLEEYHITIKKEGKNNYILIRFKEDVVNNRLIPTGWRSISEKIARLSDLPNLDGTLVTN